MIFKDRLDKAKLSAKANSEGAKKAIETNSCPSERWEDWVQKVIRDSSIFISRLSKEDFDENDLVSYEQNIEEMTYKLACLTASKSIIDGTQGSTMRKMALFVMLCPNLQDTLVMLKKAFADVTSKGLDSFP